MKTFKSLMTVLLASTALLSFAQNEKDAFIFSQESINGSARFNALGGAMTSLGGDVSAVYYNPASLGVYNTSEWGVSLGIHSNFSSADFLGKTTETGKSNMNIPTASFVQVHKDLGGKWKSGAFSVVLNRANTFHQEFTYTGDGSATSLQDDYLNIIDETNTSWQDLNSEDPVYPYDIYLAWQSYLIDAVQDSLGNVFFYTNVGLDPLSQTYSETVSGAKRETALSYGANYDDKLYIGAGLVFSRIVYDKTYTFSERMSDTDTTTFLEDYTYRFDERTTGLGIGANIGVIYRPLNQLRIGASVKTPTRYSLDIEYTSNMTTNFADTSFFERSPYEGFYEYRLRTPWRSNVGLSYIFGKYGLISADVEFVNYPNTSLFRGSDGYAFDYENTQLESQLQNSFNYRVGGEYRITSNWSARAGYAYYSNPYGADVDDNAGFQIYSGGLGYRDGNYYVDVSYQYKQSGGVHYAYDQSIANRAVYSKDDHFITASLGFRF